jgi:hypothetical protein
MKKILFILSCVILTAASSCTKQYIQPNPNQTILFNVPASAWTTTDGGLTYSAVLNTPEIDQYFNDNGGTLVYFSFITGVYEQIPEVYQGISYSYTHNPGSLALYAQSSTGATTITAPAAATVKLVLVASSQ